ncbi:MAG: amidohydrolase [Cyclobacteriaceae bacterium]
MKALSAEDNKRLVNLRRRLHREAELSGQEYGTLKTLSKFLRKSRPDEVIPSLGGTGLAVVYKGTEPGPSVMLRADMDALPIHETNEMSYRSINEHVSHKCGHDGHMAMVAGVGLAMKYCRPVAGKVILLFQPAEETGHGARQILDDPRFERLRPDVVYGLHNLPRHPMHKLYLTDDTFASASCGITVELTGHPAHAGTPHTGVSPALAIGDLISGFNELSARVSPDLIPLVTVVHIQVGEKAFGVAPGHGEISATLRSRTTEGMELLAEEAKKMAMEIAGQYDLEVATTLSDVFPSTQNHKAPTEKLKKAAEKSGIPHEFLQKPFSWSEDFGHYLIDMPGSFFGLGAGEDTPDLHSENYDFPDELIGTGVSLYLALLEEVTQLSACDGLFFNEPV